MRRLLGRANSSNVMKVIWMLEELGQTYRTEVLGYLDGNRALLGHLLAEHLPAVRYQPPEGTYLAWLDCRELGLGDHPGEFFLDRAQVLVNDGPAFGEAGRGHVRLNFATPRPILTRIVTQLAAAVGTVRRP